VRHDRIRIVRGSIAGSRDGPCQQRQNPWAQISAAAPASTTSVHRIPRIETAVINALSYKRTFTQISPAALAT
jgi:hypothetical protein